MPEGEVRTTPSADGWLPTKKREAGTQKACP